MGSVGKLVFINKLQRMEIGNDSKDIEDFLHTFEVVWRALEETQFKSSAVDDLYGNGSLQEQFIEKYVRSGFLNLRAGLDLLSVVNAVLEEYFPSFSKELSQKIINATKNKT